MSESMLRRIAVELVPALQALGLNTSFIATEIGVAAAVKMGRSVVIKGLEALAVESMLAVRQDALVDAMAAHGVAYPQGQPFSWRRLADALEK